jgi:hypothetical protein
MFIWAYEFLQLIYSFSGFWIQKRLNRFWLRFDFGLALGKPVRNCNFYIILEILVAIFKSPNQVVHLLIGVSVMWRQRLGTLPGHTANFYLLLLILYERSAVCDLKQNRRTETTASQRNKTKPHRGIPPLPLYNHGPQWTPRRPR